MEKIHTSSGSKYNAPLGAGSVPLKPTYKPVALGAKEEDWGDAEPVTQTEMTKVQSSYQPTKVDIHAIRNSGREKAEPVKSSYEPVGKVDIASIRAQGKSSKFSDDRPTPVQGSYQPVGKVDIAAIRAQAKANPNYRETIESTPVRTPVAGEDQNDKPQISSVKDRMKNFSGSPAAPEQQEQEDQEDETPKSVKDRMSAFSSTGRLTELPKPKVQNTVGSRFTPGAGGRGTAPALPTDSYSKSSSIDTGFKNFASENGKTPAQLWAEKHAKNSPAPPAREPAQDSPEREQEPEKEPEQEEQLEKPSISSLRDKFSGTGLQETNSAPAPPAPVGSSSVDQGSNTSFSDLTSKFAKQASPSPPPREPSPVQIANPVARASEPEPEPELEPARQVPPPPPSAPQMSDNNSAVAAAQQAVASAVGTTSSNGPTTSSGPVAVAEYDYEVSEEGEIGFAEGELITDIDFVDTDWWQGTNARGETGLFPANFVELRDDASAAQAPAAPAAPEPTPSAAPAAAGADKGTTATAEFDYEVAEEGEIGFTAGETITNIEFVDDDWWQGTNAQGQTGLFPGNHVTVDQ